MKDNQLSTKQPTLKAMLSQSNIQEQFSKALPKHLTVDRFTRVALTALAKTPTLAQCDQASFFTALLDLSSMGLEPDNRKAYLIPFNNRKANKTECQLIVSYQGLQELVRRSGQVAEMHCDLVCQNDKFDAGVKDGHLYLDCQPAFQERGEVIGAFSSICLREGGLEWEYMTKQELEAIRSQSQGKNAGPWTKHWGEMARKTVFRRHAKRLPLSVEVQDAIAKDDHHAGMDFAKGSIEVESFVETPGAPRVAEVPGTKPANPRELVKSELSRLEWVRQQAQALADAEGVVDDPDKNLGDYTDRELLGLLPFLQER